VRTLGGKDNIAIALNIAWDVIGEDKSDFAIGVHIGPYAGQNQGHLHYHLVKTLPFESGKPKMTRQEKTQLLCKNYSYFIFREGHWAVVVGGLWAGQCFILPASPSLPTAKPMDIGEEASQDLAKVLIRIITLYNEKFLSKEGLPPDYRITLRIKNGKVFGGWYTPILNFWGFDQEIALLEGRLIVLPWPHETTVKHLLGK